MLSLLSVYPDGCVLALFQVMDYKVLSETLSLYVQVEDLKEGGRQAKPYKKVFNET